MRANYSIGGIGGRRASIGAAQRLGGQVSDVFRMFGEERVQLSKECRHFGIASTRSLRAQFPDPLIEGVNLHNEP